MEETEQMEIDKESTPLVKGKVEQNVTILFRQYSGYLILRDGAILHNKIDLKLHPIAQFEENHIIRKKMLNSSI